MNGWDFLRRN